MQLATVVRYAVVLGFGVLIGKSLDRDTIVPRSAPYTGMETATRPARAEDAPPQTTRVVGMLNDILTSVPKAPESNTASEDASSLGSRTTNGTGASGVTLANFNR